MTLLFTDDFNRANGSLGSPWVEQLGTWTIVSTTLARCSVLGSGLPGGPSGIVTVDSVKDFDVSYKKAAADVNGQCLIFRYVDNNNFWMVQGDNTQCLLRKCVGGSFTAFGSSFGLINNGDTVRVTASGSAINVYLNGVLKKTVSDSTHDTATQIGLGSQGTGQRFDDFSISSSLAAPGTVKLEFAYGGQNNSFSLAWTDATSSMWSATVTRGRRSMFDMFDPGSMSVTIRSDSFNTDLLPWTPVRLSASDSTGIRYNIFTGFVSPSSASDYQFQKIAGGTLGTFNIDCVDILSWLANIDLLALADEDGNPAPAYAGLKAGALLVAQFPEGISPLPAWATEDFDTGISVLQGTALGTDGLSFAQQVAQSEGGWLFADRDGVLVFHDRYATQRRTASALIQETFDSDGLLGSSFKITMSGTAPTYPYTQATAQREGSIYPQTYQTADTTALDNYGTNGYKFPPLLCGNDAQVLERAEYLVKVSIAATPYVSRITLFPIRDDQLDAALHRELRDRVYIVHADLGAFDCWVERITHRMDSHGSWETDLELSSRDAFVGAFPLIASDDIFVLDDSLLDGNSYLGF